MKNCYILLLFFPLYALGQPGLDSPCPLNDCQCMLDKADALVNAEQPGFERALNLYFAVKACNDSLSGLAETKIVQLFEKVEALRIDAEQKARLIERQQQQLKKEKREALLARDEASKERDAANAARDTARQATRQAQIDRDNARDALAKLEASNAEVARLILQNADKDILRLDHLAALEKIKAAAALSVSKKEVANAFIELAFWFAETNRLDSAKTATAAAARLLSREGLAAEAEKTSSRSALLALLKGLDNDYFDFLAARYFPDFVRIPEGEFMMGSPDSIGSSDEHPQHPVRLSAFDLGRTEVTYWQFAVYAENKGFDIATFAPDWGISGDHPVVNVTWYDAARYANWLSIYEGLDSVYVFGDEGVEMDTNANGYRLPTEAQWEYAAGNGAEHTTYSWGNELPIGKKGGNVADETAKRKFPDWTIFTGYEDGFIYTAPVDSFDSNNFGLFDMSGNVWEWCWDWYDSGYYEKSKNSRDPRGPDSGSGRVIRGGSWSGDPASVRVAIRSDDTPDLRSDSFGFRLARAVR